MHQHVAIPGRRLRLRHRALDPIGHVRHQWIVRHRRAGRPVRGHEDRDTSAVVLTAPVIDDLGGSPTHQHRAGRVHFVDQCSDRPLLPDELPVRSEYEPIVQPVAIVATELIVGVSDVPVE